MVSQADQLKVPKTPLKNHWRQANQVQQGIQPTTLACTFNDSFCVPQMKEIKANSYGFDKKWWWVNDNFIFVWTIPLPCIRLVGTHKMLSLKICNWFDYSPNESLFAFILMLNRSFSQVSFHKKKFVICLVWKYSFSFLFLVFTDFAEKQHYGTFKEQFAQTIV